MNKKPMDYIYDALYWCDHNREVLIVGLPLIIGGLGKLGRMVTTNRRTNEMKRHRELDIYDRSLGIYYSLRRKPSAAEYGEINRRKKAGEDYYTILSSMRLL